MLKMVGDNPDWKILELGSGRDGWTCADTYCDIVDYKEYYKNKREEDRVKRYVNNLHASDEYVRRLEDQLVMTRAFITYNKLEPDLEKYKQKVQEVNNATKKEKTKT